VVTEDSTIYCPAAITIGSVTLKNWTKIPEGSIDVKRALARSCNTWFYQVGIDVGPSAFLNLSRRLGFGERTALPLMGETPGLVPSDEWMLKNEKRRILQGDTANLSIGQGSLLASPLQVAQAMAGIANGGALPKLQLIRQTQDTRGRVVQVATPERKNWIGMEMENVKIVHKGMRDVVSGGGGTGKNAALSYATLCGKTGTAQWGPKAKNQRLAWFAGFVPYDNPRYAFAVLYEGSPGEGVSGGRMAAPMVKRFFESIKEDIKDIITPPKKALVVDENDLGSGERSQEDEGEKAKENEPSVEPASVPPLRALPVDPSEEESHEEQRENPDPTDHPLEGLRPIPRSPGGNTNSEEPGEEP
jgi:penicillin-binding protein 2